MVPSNGANEAAGLRSTANLYMPLAVLVLLSEGLYTYTRSLHVVFVWFEPP